MYFILIFFNKKLILIRHTINFDIIKDQLINKIGE